MDEAKRKKLSKYLSLILRHRPDSIGVELDAHGWARIADLIAGARAGGRRINREQILEVVEHNAKQRFAISEDGLRIRVNQGHSVAIELDYASSKPPEVLYHGTVERVLGEVFAWGFAPWSRIRHDSLSEAVATIRNPAFFHIDIKNTKL